LPVDLNRRASVVRQNFRNRRGKIIHTGARNDDAIAAAMSFLDDAQEFPALVLPELDVEMLALNLQFSRLDDVIHFYWRRRLYRNGFVEWKKNRRPFVQFSQQARDESLIRLRSGQAVCSPEAKSRRGVKRDGFLGLHLFTYSASGAN
jgi:hypothetical protein